MWWLILLTLATPATAQRPFCDFGTGVTAVRDAQARLAAPVTGLVTGRETGLAIAATLEAARATFAACGCPHLTDLTDEAARLTEQTGYEASAARIAQTFTQAGFRVRLARQAMDTNGCR